MSTHTLTLSIHGTYSWGVMQALVALIEEWLALDRRNQAELARLSGVPQNVISRWLNGQVDSVSTRNLKRVAPVLGLSYEELLRRMGELPQAAASVNGASLLHSRQQSLDDQVERWVRVLGPRMGVEAAEDYFWESVRRHADTILDALTMGTAVSAPADTAVNGAVSVSGEGDDELDDAAGGGLRARYHTLNDLLAPALNKANGAVTV
jgi:transcriptional regulator with XRE-family HTH domain